MGRSKGVLYVNTQDFAIVRLDFENVKPLSKFGLLGINYRNDVFRCKMLFDKDLNGSYSPRYLELNDGGYMGLDRPLKVIEKNKNGMTCIGANIYNRYSGSNPPKIGTLIAANSGRPGGGCGNFDGTIGNIHQNHRTQEEDIMSNWFMTYANNKNIIDEDEKKNIIINYFNVLFLIVGSFISYSE